MDRLSFEERLTIRVPEIEGRITPRGSFKETITALKSSRIGNVGVLQRGIGKKAGAAKKSSRADRRAEAKELFHQVRKLHRRSKATEPRPNWNDFKLNGMGKDNGREWGRSILGDSGSMADSEAWPFVPGFRPNFCNPTD